MHTLRPSNGKYDVIFEIDGVQRTVEQGLTKIVAMQMVNFLNGGYGHKFSDRMINPTVNVYGSISDADKI